MKRLCCTILLVVVCSVAIGGFAGDDCTQQFWMWTVDKASARALQQSVSEGHQPWRMDDVVAVAEQAVDGRKSAWGDAKTVIGTPKVLTKTGGEAVLLASSSDGSIRYVVTLRKYGWLLEAARNDWRQVIWLPASVERSHCASQKR